MKNDARILEIDSDPFCYYPNHFTQGRRMISIRFISSVLFLATALLQPLHATAAEEEGKFHLVYLVSAVDLKPGSKVFVDPIFFTDGKEVKNFHDYCQMREQFLKVTKIGEGAAILDSYCGKRAFTLSPKDYTTLNNHGEQVRIDDIAFKVQGVAGLNKEPVMMGEAKVRSFTAGSVSPPRLPRQDGAPEYFFLMSKDKTVLRMIVPVSKATEMEMQTLAKKAIQASENAAGVVSFTSSIDISRVSGGQRVKFTREQITVQNLIFVDINGDDLVDVVAGVHAASRRDRKGDDWVGVIYTMSHGRVLLGRWALSLGVRNIEGQDCGIYQEYLRNNYPVTTPLVAVRIGECTYALRYLYDVSTDIPSGLLMEGKEFVKSRLGCSDQTLVKIFGSP